MKRDLSMIESLHLMFQDIEASRNMIVERVEMDALNFAKLRQSCGDDFDPCTHKEILQSGVVGYLWSAGVYVGESFGDPQVYGSNELPPENTLWIRRGWEKPEL